MADDHHAATADPLCHALAKPIPGTGPIDPLAPDDGTPRWQQLVMLAPPGIDALVSTVSPPLQVIAAVLTVIAALLDVLAALLMALPDLYKALIMAAYEALKALIQDFINAGFYFYFDAGGVTSIEDVADQMGVPTQPVTTFTAGLTGAPPPPIPPDRFVTWSDRFSASFDDPGDENRPVFSDGAQISAVFIVAAAPSFDALRQLLYLLGQLFNIDPFLALDYNPSSPDPDLTRARGKPVAPDWESLRLKDIFPPLAGLMAIPEALKGLLLGGENLASLIQALAEAIKAKAKTLQDIVAVLQAIIDLLAALKSTGLYALPVATDQGVTGLRQGFIEAQDRPPGGFVAGVCVLAGGPGIPAASTLFAMLGQTPEMLSFQNTLAAAEAELEQSAADAAAQLADAMAGSKTSSPDASEAARQNPAAAAQQGLQSSDPRVAAAARKVDRLSRRARKRGARSLAFGLGLGPEQPQPGPPEPAPVPLADPDDDCGKRS